MTPSSAAPDPTARPAFAIVGRIRRAHGIHGEVLVEPITDAPDAVFAPGRRVFGGTARGDLPVPAPALVVTGCRPFKGGILATFDIISDRTTAERWQERYLFAPQDELEPLREDEVYRHELLGMTVRLADGGALGEVADLYDLPQGLMLDVRLASGKGTVMLPYVPGTIVRVDRAAREVIVAPPEGLLD